MKKALSNGRPLPGLTPAERRAKARPFLLPDRRTQTAEPLPALPFNRFSKVGTEFTFIQQAIDAMQISGDGRFTNLCHDILEKSLGVRKKRC